jgi:hypothetical protein
MNSRGDHVLETLQFFRLVVARRRRVKPEIYLWLFLAAFKMGLFSK